MTDNGVRYLIQPCTDLGNIGIRKDNRHRQFPGEGERRFPCRVSTGYSPLFRCILEHHAISSGVSGNEDGQVSYLQRLSFEDRNTAVIGLA